jgi:alanine dehydrogenase
MNIGVVREIKEQEDRVALTPAGAEMLARAGHAVVVQSGAGNGSGFADAAYARAGAEVVASAAEVYARGDLIVKVKEPLPAEYDLLRPDHLLFTYLHLAASEPVTRALLARGVTAIAYETVQLADGRLPLLTPMSEIAGRMAIQVAAHYLERPHGGRGKLLGGVPGVYPCRVVIVGGGTVGANAAQMALGLGAQVTVIDRDLDRLRQLSGLLHGHLVTVMSTHQTIANAVQGAEVVIGAVLVAGARAPQLVSREMIAGLEPGSVVVDVAVDQGGCVATSRPTTHHEPIYSVDGVIHYCVANMPGAVPRTATYALSNATLPAVLALAEHGLVEAVRRDPALARGVNVYQGHITHRGVAEAFDLEYVPLARLIGGLAEERAPC